MPTPLHKFTLATLALAAALGLSGRETPAAAAAPKRAGERRQSAPASPLTFADSRLRATGSARIDAHPGGAAVHLVIDNPDGAGLEIRPRNGDSWDLSGWETLALDVKSLSSDRQQRLVMTVTSLPTPDSGGKAREVTVGVGVNPGETRVLRLPLSHRWQYGAPAGIPGVRVLDTAHITKITLNVQWPFEKPAKGLVDCELSHFRVEDKVTPPPPATDAAAYLPFVDRYGQFSHTDWPEKIHADADLTAAYAREGVELARNGRPASWDRFGGWKNGPQLKATGSFRTEKVDGKWWLVDPDGRLYLSQGIDVLSASGEAFKIVPGRENWFSPPLAPGLTNWNAVNQNLRIKYGRDDYQAAYYDRLTRRLERWGINAIGDWSSPDLMALGGIPYTLQLTDYDDRMPKIQGVRLKFYDVFDPAYIAKMKNLVATAATKNPMVTRSLTDPMCLGYFIDNELDFGNRGRMTLVEDILRTPATQAAKREFARDLKAKYGTVKRLNASWATSYADWAAFLATTTVVPTTDAYRADADAFFRKTVDQYFRLAHDAVKSVAPNRLYLGVRFIGTDAPRPVLADACRKWCDVLSVNIYAHSAANFPTVAQGFPDMPVLVTEFQFGIMQRGMFSASLCQAGVTPEDRALAYTRFVEGVLAHPNMVGVQYFQYRDQPLTGRNDGERYQIGFVDVADTPYPEMTRAARALGEEMYAFRAAAKLPTTLRGQPAAKASVKTSRSALTAKVLSDTVLHK